MIPYVRCRELEDLVSTVDVPVLVACLSADYNYTRQLNILRELAAIHEGACIIRQMNVEELCSSANGLHIGGTPTFLLFMAGKEQGRLLGFADVARLQLFIERVLSGLETRVSCFESGTQASPEKRTIGGVK